MRALPVALVGLGAFAGAGCARAPERRELVELERLVLVPPGECVLWPSTDLSLPAAIVFDRFELTRADLHHYWPERNRRADELAWTTDAAQDSPERADWPAFVDFHEAEELAALRGMRLPTPQEWLYVAVGRRSFTNPWGGSGREYFANTVVEQGGKDFSLGMPSIVGTYENGRSRPFGCYDLLGNVWEWVDGVVLGYEPAFGPEGGSGGTNGRPDDGAGSMASVMGGAFDTSWRTTYELDRNLHQQRFHARTLDKRTLSPSIGARMCADAGPYLLAMAGRWGDDVEAHRRVRAVAERWAEYDPARQVLRVLLTELRARPGAPVQLGWLEEGVRASP